VATINRFETDEEPPTARISEIPEAPSEQVDDYSVEIIYREPSYALYSGTDRAYSAGFLVRARSLNAAIAEARSRFEQIAALSGVSWSRVIESMSGRRLEPDEPREAGLLAS